MRLFRDAAGVEWRVYQTERTRAGEGRRDHLLPPAYRQGWLVFESKSDKRRLAPVPPGWSDLSDEALTALCASAIAQTWPSKRREAPGGRDTADVAAPGGEDQQTTGSEASELHAIEERLTETLHQVCDGPSAAKLNTGELIRIEETLAIATETAKDVVSLRRKRRRQGAPRELHEREPRD